MFFAPTKSRAKAVSISFWSTCEPLVLSIILSIPYKTYKPPPPASKGFVLQSSVFLRSLVALYGLKQPFEGPYISSYCSFQGPALHYIGLRPY